MTTPGNTVTPEMPERVIAYRSNVDGSIMVVPLMDGEEPNIDETLFIRATLLTEARELLKRFKDINEPECESDQSCGRCNEKRELNDLAISFLERVRPL